jgi:hypothetical protein
MSIQLDIEAQLAAIALAITTAIANPAPNWTVGNVRFDQAGYLAMLLEQQGKLLEQLRDVPSESIDAIQNEVGPLGTDGTEYLGEDL